MYRYLKKIKSKLVKVKTSKTSEDEYYIKLFTENANWNKSTPNPEEELRWNIIKEFVQYVIDQRKELSNINMPVILDIGCGRGWLSNLLSQYGNVTGIEPVKKVVEFGKTLFPGLNLLCGTTTDLLNAPGHNKYDLIVCSEVIEHIPDNKKDEFIGDIKSLLTNNGFLILTTPRKEAQIEWMKYCSPNQPIEDWIEESKLQGILHKRNFKTHLLKRLSAKLSENAAEIEIYQLWLFQDQQM